MKSLLCVRRGFCAGNSMISVLQGSGLHRFAGLACEDDYPVDCEDSNDEFDTRDGSFPIVAEVQRSKPGIRRMVSDSWDSSGLFASSLRGQFRSKKAEEEFKRAHMIFDGAVKVRVMDVDEFRLDELHHYFMFTLVRRFPAERCVKIASRVALFRDKHSQHSFESMSKDVGNIFGATHGAELTALFARCYNTIPVAFMLDYTRRFGKFSKRYIAMQVEKTLKPRLFDFVRYPSGVRPLPGIVTRPFALRSFAWLLPPCSAKRYLFQHLLAHSGDSKALEKLAVEDRDIFNQIRSGKEMDPQSAAAAKLSERISSSWRVRPLPLAQIEADVYKKQPASADDIVEVLESSMSRNSVETDDHYDPFASQKTKVQSFKSPLSEDTDALVDTRWSEEGVGVAEMETPDESWWKYRQTSKEFFRFNKKAFRLTQEEGWKQVEDPRGEKPDYKRHKMLRNSKRKISSIFKRRIAKKRRDSLISTIITKAAQTI